MTLIITHANHNPLRTSKLFPQIVELAKAKGLKTIGACYVDKTTHPWTCHKCNTKNPKPQMDNELLTECPNCKYPFLLTLA